MSYRRNLVAAVAALLTLGTSVASAEQYQQIARSARMGVEVFGVSQAGDWCAEEVTLQVRAKDTAFFATPEIDTLMKLVGGRVLPDQCPAAKAAKLLGTGANGGPTVWRGTTAAAQSWAVVEQVLLPPVVATSVGATAGSTPERRTTGGAAPVSASAPKTAVPSAEQHSVIATTSIGATAGSTPEQAARLPERDYCGPAGEEFRKKAISFFAADELLGPFAASCKAHDQCYVEAARRIIQLMESRYQLSSTSTDLLDKYRAAATTVLESEKQACDTAFLTQIKQACSEDPKRAFKNLLDPTPANIATNCNAVSNIYYQAVRSRVGDKAFEGALASALQSPRTQLAADQNSTTQPAPVPPASPTMSVPSALQVPADRQPYLLTIDGIDPNMTCVGNAVTGLVAQGRGTSYLLPKVRSSWEFITEQKSTSAPWSGDLCRTSQDIEAVKSNIATWAKLAKSRQRPFVVVGHSWGTVLAYRSIIELAQDGRLKSGDIYALITMGSPISPRGADGGARGTAAATTVPNHLNWIGVMPVKEIVRIWRNYWITEDGFSNGIRGLPDTDNIRMVYSASTDGSDAHKAYFSSPRLWQQIRNDLSQHMAKDTIKPPPVARAVPISSNKVNAEAKPLTRSSAGLHDGIWTGEVIERQRVGYKKYPVRVTIDSAKGIYTIDYTTLGCGGQLQVIHRNEEILRAAELLRYGHNLCMDKGVVRLTAAGSGKMEFDYTHPQHAEAKVSGTLLREGNITSQPHSAPRGLPSAQQRGEQPTRAPTGPSNSAAEKYDGEMNIADEFYLDRIEAIKRYSNWRSIRITATNVSVRSGNINISEIQIPNSVRRKADQMQNQPFSWNQFHNFAVQGNNPLAQQWTIVCEISSEVLSNNNIKAGMKVNLLAKLKDAGDNLVVFLCK